MTGFGGAQRTNFLWNALRQCGDVHCLYFDNKSETVEIAPKVWRVKKILKRHGWKSFFYRLERKILRPYHVLPLWPIPTLLDKQLKEIYPDVTFDIVVCRYCFDLMEMHLWHFPKVYVDFDDHPSEMYETLGSLDVKPKLRPIGRWLIKMQVAYILRKISGGWISNPNQVKAIEPKFNIRELRNIPQYPSEKYNPLAVRNQQLLIVGAMNYYPNYSGVDKFLTEVWKKVYEKYPTLELLIVGKGLPTEYLEAWKNIPNVKQLGFVEDLESVYEKSLAAIVPIYSGGGTCIKTLETLAHSRVCISSPFGARGLEHCIDSKVKALQVYESYVDFIHILDNLVQNPDIRLVAEKEGYEYIHKNYSEQKFSQAIIETLNVK